MKHIGSLLNKKTIYIFIASFIIIGSLTAVKVIISYFATYKAAQQALADQYMKIAEDIVNGLDKTTYKKVLVERQKDNEDHYKIRNYLKDYHNKIRALYIYTLVFDDADNSKVMVTATPPELPLGTVECMIPAKQVRQLKHRESIFTDIIVDEKYGVYLSVAAPILGENGVILGAVGIDISAESLDQVGKHVIKNNIIIFAVDILFAVLLLIVIFLLRIWFKNRLQKDLKETEQFYITELGNIVESLKTTRHDYNNHFQVLYGLLEMKMFDKAVDYLKTLHNETKVLELSVKVKHPALLVLFNIKWELANSKGIQISFDSDSSDFKKIVTTDLVKIFSNLIDNAIEATEFLHEEFRMIHVVCKRKGNHYLFSVENNAHLSSTEVRSLFKQGFSTKMNGNKNGDRVRGNGLSIVKRTVEKYSGDLYYKYQNNRLIIQILIPV